jgi:hypothetical protein
MQLSPFRSHQREKVQPISENINIQGKEMSSGKLNVDVAASFCMLALL